MPSTEGLLCFNLLEYQVEKMSQIEKFQGLKHVYKLMGSRIHCQLVLGWNLTWVYVLGPCWAPSFGVSTFDI